MFRVVSSPIIRSTQLYLQCLVLVNRYCYLPVLWESWSWPECGVGSVQFPHHTQTSSNSPSIEAGNNNGYQVQDTVTTVVFAPDDGWRYHQKHVEQFSRNK